MQYYSFQIYFNKDGSEYCFPGTLVVIFTSRFDDNCHNLLSSHLEIVEVPKKMTPDSEIADKEF